MARLYQDPFHPCPVCKRLTDNHAACDDCLDFMNFMLNCYEERKGELWYKWQLPPPQVKPPDPS